MATKPAATPGPALLMANVLNVYYYKGEYPPRASVADHLYSFKKYAGPQDNCFYLNVAVRSAPSYLKNVRFDVVIFHTIFFSARWDRTLFRQMMRDLSRLKHLNAVKVALPQDEFLNTDLLCDFINEYGVDYVFSVAPESEWETIYSSVDRSKVKFANVLTGYLDDATLANIDRLAAADRRRTIDVGYRAWRGAEWLGRHGFLKAQISDVFEQEAPPKGLVTDVSTRPGDTFFGAAWYEFLLRCKYLIGVEGGASILDRDGSIREKTEAYVRAHPSATFDEIEANCFPNMDGSLKLFAISPRHLEACATRTCQVLVEGEYNGILEPGTHYIELKRDFSNLAEVLGVMAEDHLRAGITERAYRDIVASGQYTYRSFVGLVIARALDTAAPSRLSSEGRRPLTFQWMRAADKLSWLAVMFNWHVAVPARRRLRRLLVKIFPEQYVFSLLRRLRRG
jgi:hypothetical protein